MLLRTLSLSLTAGVIGAGAHATPVSIDALAGIFHDYTVNSGSVPEGIRLGTTPGTLDINGSVNVDLDRADTVQTDVPFVQVGNPFSTPAVPYLAQRQRSLDTLGGDASSTAQYDISVSSVDDPDANAMDTSIVERTTDFSGRSTLTQDNGLNTAEASSGYFLERGYTFTNTTDNLISFNIVGQMTADMSAAVSGSNGTARSVGQLFTEFAPAEGVDINFLGLSPYLRTIMEDDAGAISEDQLLTGDDGIYFSATNLAVGDGTDTDAAFSMNYRYIFMISMAGGSTLNMLTGARMATGAVYDTVTAPVPLPASALFGLLGLTSLAGLRSVARRRI